jgi:hypothetical protein
MEFLLYAYIIPLGAFILVLCLIAIRSMKRARENEDESNRDPRLREVEILNRIYALDAMDDRREYYASHSGDGSPVQPS